MTLDFPVRFIDYLQASYRHSQAIVVELCLLLCPAALLFAIYRLLEYL